MPTPLQFSRREILTTAAASLTLAGLGSPYTLRAAEKEVPTQPGEDLMQEHGVLKRILLIYGHLSDELGQGASIPADALHKSATIIHDFIEDYHEKDEEHYIFPRFRKANKLVDLVDLLELQHKRGRMVTERILANATSSSLSNSTARTQVKSDLDAFIRMYAPHEAREDTVLFPAFRAIVTEKEYKDLGDKFEDEEHKRFGEKGFEHMVDRVAEIEKSLGIYDLSQFTPPA